MQHVILITIYTCISLFINCNSTVNKTGHIIRSYPEVDMWAPVVLQEYEGFGCICFVYCTIYFLHNNISICDPEIFNLFGLQKLSRVVKHVGTCSSEVLINVDRFEVPRFFLDFCVISRFSFSHSDQLAAQLFVWSCC